MLVGHQGYLNLVVAVSGVVRWRANVTFRKVLLRPFYFNDLGCKVDRGMRLYQAVVVLQVWVNLYKRHHATQHFFV